MAMMTATMAAVVAMEMAAESTMAAPANCQPLPSAALVNCCHPPLPLPPLFGFCSVVHCPLSLLFIARCCAIINALVAGRFHRQSLTSALRWSCHQPPPAFTSSNDGSCCVVICCLLSSLPIVMQLLILSSPRCPQALLLPAAACLCHSQQWLVVALLSTACFCCCPP